MDAHAVVFTAPNTVEYQPVTCPDPGPSHIVVRLTHSWISNGTEGSFLRGERIEGDTAYRPNDPWPFPIVAGYQRIGVVEWVGEQIEDIEVGDTVFSTQGLVNGMYKERGGQISPSVSGRDGVWKLPQGVDPLAFAGLVLTQVGYNCSARPSLQPGDPAVVIGDGLVGQWAAQTLHWRGAEVALVGRHPDRLAYFGQRPGRHLIDASQQDWGQAVRALFPNGTQVLVDTVGSVPVLEQSIDLMRREGHLVSAGFYGTKDEMPLQPPRYKELTIDLVSGWTKDRMDRTLALIAAGYLETLPLITHHFPVAQAAAAWDLIETKREPVLGVILDWS
ncbi:MAG: zinc-binding dehydrogenase [Candidatus Latescibacteria bacterium]|nr:zinc-binding dehydrogenase [Candidatus Latescibacterota bacterium]